MRSTIDNGGEVIGQVALSLAQGIMDTLVQKKIMSQQEADQLLDEAASAQTDMAQTVAQQPGARQNALTTPNGRAARLLQEMGGSSSAGPQPGIRQPMPRR